MATKSFALNTKPHIANIGDEELELRPEVMGDEFLDAYNKLQEITSNLRLDPEDTSHVDTDEVRKAGAATRVFLAGLMLPDSAGRFAQWEVRAADGAVLGSHPTPDEAREEADTVEGSTVVFTGMVLPDRIIVDLLEWSVELYGGQRPPTSSSGSAPASPPRGTAGRGNSRSKASTSTRGR